MPIETLTVLDEIDQIKPAWTKLLNQSACNRAFSSPDWYIGCCLYTQEKPVTFVLSHNGIKKAILPLIMSKDSRTLRFSSQLADYNDLIAAEGDFKSATSLMIGVLALIDRDTGLLLENLREDSALYQVIISLDEEILCRNRVRVNRLRTENCFFVDTRQSYSEYISTRSIAFRKDIKRKRKIFLDTGFAMEEFQPEENEIPALIDKFLELHKFRIRDTIFLEDKHNNMLRNVISNLIYKGYFRVFLIRRNKEIYAIQLSAEGRDSLAAWNGGFNNEVSKISPGKLLIEFQISRCIEQGKIEFDLLRGNENYKKRWSTGKRFLNTIFIDHI